MRFRQDPQTHKLLTIAEYREKYPSKPMGRAPIVFCSNFTPFVSMVTGEVIRNKKDHKFDLESTSSRVYEGREQETKEADRIKNYETEKFSDTIEKSMESTYHDIEHGYVEPSESTTQVWDWDA